MLLSAPPAMILVGTLIRAIRSEISSRLPLAGHAFQAASDARKLSSMTNALSDAESGWAVIESKIA